MAFKYPWTNLHELNLDWILSQIRQLTKQIAKFTGLTASAHSVPYGTDPTVDITGGAGNEPYNLDFGIPEAATSAVNTVNGQSGDVVLTASDIGLGNVDNVQQYSATNPPPYPVTSVNGMTGDVIVQGGGGGSDVLSVNGQSGVVVLDKDDIGLSNVDDVQQYSATNPPPYPVTSVNTQTGDVTLGSLVDVSANLTATADLTIEEAYCAKIGQLVTYYIAININASTPASTELFRGLHLPIANMTGGFNIVGGTVVPFTVARSSGIGIVVAQNVLPIGRRTLALTYLSES